MQSQLVKKCIVFFIGVVLVAGNVHLNDKYRSVIDGKQMLSLRLAREIYDQYQSTSYQKSDYRFLIFYDTLLEIQKHNLGDHTWMQGINDYSDMTFQEFKINKVSAPQDCSATDGVRQFTYPNIPDSYQWNDLGVVTPVKNQGNCGSCWAFSTIGAMEAHWNILQKGKNLTFSEQQLVDCAGDFKNKGCNGGLPSQAFEYIRYNGLELGSSYPYVAANRPCKHNVSKNVAYAKYGSYNVTKGNEQELAEKLATKGPISVTFHVTASFRNYAGGVYTVKNCPNTSRDVNHAVLATGYGTEKGLKFWNIKNSWGASWGVKGYFKMERDVNMCGVAQCNAYPLIDAQVHSEPIVGAEEYSWVDQLSNE